MYKDNQGTFWFSTDKLEIYKYDGKTFVKFYNKVVAIFIYINKIQLSNGKIKRYL
jgi:hypothetical protein